MTREEAIQRLKTTDACDVDLCEALDMAIKALEQKPCGDCISREAVSKLLNDGWWKGIYPREAIMALPSVTPQPKMGRWIKDKCSICGEERAWYGQNPPYCPDCGSYNGGEG